MTYENYIKAHLASFAFEEAAHLGGILNMLAVAQVMSNRVEAGWHGGDWLAVLRNAPDASYRLPEEEAPAAHRLQARDPMFRELLRKVDDVYHRAAENLVEGALYFAELDKITRPWFVRNISQDPQAHPRIATVGLVSFFL